MNKLYARPIFLNIIVVCISLLVGLGVFEGILRLFAIGYGNNPLESSALFHHVHPENYSFLVYDPQGEYGGFTVYYDNYGRRYGNGESAKPLSNRKIMFLGDSFTEANQVPWDESFVGLTSKEHEVVNLGVSSYSPVLYVALLKKFIQQEKPTDVVMQIYFNDFSDDEYYFRFSGARSINDVDHVDGSVDDKYVKLLRYSYLARFFRKAQLSLQYKFTNETAHYSILDPNFDENSLTIKAINVAKDIAARNGAKFYVFIIPNKLMTKSNSCCDGDITYTKFNSIMKKNGIPVIDVASSFADSADQERIFFNNDIHLTAYGHLLVHSKLKSSIN